MSRTHFNRSSTIAVLISVCLVPMFGLNACGDDGHSDRSGDDVRPPNEDGEIDGGGVVETTPTVEPSSVEVRIREFEINMPTLLKPGPHLLQITNDGTKPHGFTFTGNGMDMALPTSVQPGETQTLPIDLAPGSYRAFCPVDGHVDRGMAVDVTVSE